MVLGSRGYILDLAGWAGVNAGNGIYCFHPRRISEKELLPFPLLSISLQSQAFDRFEQISKFYRF